jgi:hypothetical protein
MSNENTTEPYRPGPVVKLIHDTSGACTHVTVEFPPKAASSIIVHGNQKSAKQAVYQMTRDRWMSLMVFARNENIDLIPGQSMPDEMTFSMLVEKWSSAVKSWQDAKTKAMNILSNMSEEIKSLGDDGGAKAIKWVTIQFSKNNPEDYQFAIDVLTCECQSDLHELISNTEKAIVDIQSNDSVVVDKLLIEELESQINICKARILFIDRQVTHKS